MDHMPGKDARGYDEGIKCSSGGQKIRPEGQKSDTVITVENVDRGLLSFRRGVGLTDRHQPFKKSNRLKFMNDRL